MTLLRHRKESVIMIEILQHGLNSWCDSHLRWWDLMMKMILIITVTESDRFLLQKRKGNLFLSSAQKSGHSSEGQVLTSDLWCSYSCSQGLFRRLFKIHWQKQCVHRLVWVFMYKQNAALWNSVIRVYLAVAARFRYVRYVQLCRFKACATSPGCEIQDYLGGIQFHATDLTLAPETRGLMPLAHRKGF